MHTKKPIYMRYKQACGICGRRKSLYKRHQIILSANNSFMYDGAEKYLQFESSMHGRNARVNTISSKIWFLFIALTVVVVVGSPTTDLLESVDCSFRDAISQMLRPKERSIQLEISVRQAKHDSHARDNVKHDLESLLEQIFQFFLLFSLLRELSPFLLNELNAF